MSSGTLPVCLASCPRETYEMTRFALSFAISESAASSRPSSTAPPSVAGATQVAAPLAFVRWRARARRVITRRPAARPEWIGAGDLAHRALAQKEQEVLSECWAGVSSSPSMA
jgi:hypothetical protein